MIGTILDMTDNSFIIDRLTLLLSMIENNHESFGEFILTPSSWLETKQLLQKAENGVGINSNELEYMNVVFRINKRLTLESCKEEIRRIEIEIEEFLLNGYLDRARLSCKRMLLLKDSDIDNVVNLTDEYIKKVKSDLGL